MAIMASKAKLPELRLADIDLAKQQRIVSAISRTWSAISYDVGRCSAAERIEVVLDADFVRVQGNDLEAAQLLERLNYDDAKVLAKRALGGR